MFSFCHLRKLGATLRDGGLLLTLCGGLAGATDPPVADGAWTLVLIPDTQNYVKDTADTEIFMTEMRWIAAKATERRIQYARVVGSILPI